MKYPTLPLLPILTIFFLTTISAFMAVAEQQNNDHSQPSVALEALQRLKDTDLESNPALKEAVDKIIESAHGKTEFIEIARILNLKNVDSEILAIAINEGPTNSTAVEGIRFILANDNDALILQYLASASPDEANSIVDLLGNAGEPTAIKILDDLAADPKQSAELRNLTVRALARSEDGARRLLTSIAGNSLPADLQSTAKAVLRVAPWPSIQEEAATHLPPAAGTDGKPIPSLTDLLTMKGDAQRGAEVAALPQTACLACHVINDTGLDFGPALTEIGSKLSREALFAAILDPNASVSHGYTGWQITLHSNTTRTGFIVSETDSDISLKEPTGNTIQIPLSDIKKRTQIQNSLMPPGLERTMTTQQLVDLIEFLTTLKP